MERITHNYIGCNQIEGVGNRTCEEVCRQMEGKGCKECPISKAIDKLAAYEETGLEPKEIIAVFKRLGKLEVSLKRVHDVVRQVR